MRIDRDGWIHGSPLSEKESVSRLLPYYIEITMHVDGSWSVRPLNEDGEPAAWFVDGEPRGASGRGVTIGAAMDDMYAHCPWARPDPPACQPHRLRIMED